jgi:glycosyltransferase involved in cell wall biosynthesis
MPMELPQRAMLLTVLIPCFNEAAILGETVEQLRSYLDNEHWRHGLEGDWEILFVDDGSRDASRSILAELARNDPRIRYISYRINFGQGRALQKGFEAARGDWIFCVDADLDYGPEHIEKFLALAAESGAEIVVGSAYMRGGSAAGVPPIRYFMSRAMNWYFAKVLKLGFSTYTSILRLYRRSAIQSLLLTTRDKDLLPEILIKAGLLGTPMIEAPAHLHWKKRIVADARSGASIWSTARKALRHLLWGAMENPLLFFALPAMIVGIGTVWFGIAIMTLFWSFHGQTDLTGLNAITEAASEVILSNPQTVAIFAILLHAALLLFTVSMVTIQNKTKSEHDFIYFTRLMEKINDIKNDQNKGGI